MKRQNEVRWENGKTMKAKLIRLQGQHDTAATSGAANKAELWT